MPTEFVLYGPARCVLVLALLLERDTFRQCCSTPDSLDFPLQRWVNLGERLALVHPAQLADYSTLLSIMHTSVPPGEPRRSGPTSPTYGTRREFAD